MSSELMVSSLRVSITDALLDVEKLGPLLLETGDHGRQGCKHDFRGCDLLGVA